jgi:hypothetical protein
MDTPKKSSQDWVRFIENVYIGRTTVYRVNHQLVASQPVEIIAKKDQTNQRCKL